MWSDIMHFFFCMSDHIFVLSHQTSALPGYTSCTKKKLFTALVSHECSPGKQLSCFLAYQNQLLNSTRKTTFCWNTWKVLTYCTYLTNEWWSFLQRQPPACYKTKRKRKPRSKQQRSLKSDESFHLQGFHHSWTKFPGLHQSKDLTMS